MKKLRVILAGATGWAGSALAKAIAGADGLELVAAVSRKNAWKDLAQVLDIPDLKCPIFASAEEALKVPSDIFFEYTKPDQAK